MSSSSSPSIITRNNSSGSRSLHDFLTASGVGGYYESCVINGYDDLSFIVDMGEAEVREMMRAINMQQGGK